jgi:ABC-2 type transport system permease protein
MSSASLAADVPASPRQALTIGGEARLFWWLRSVLCRTAMRQALSGSRLRLSLVVCLSLVFWAGLFAVFLEGFHFLQHSIGNAATYADTVQRIYNVFFASLAVMLVLSAGIILYSGLYRSPEAALLLALPVREERIVLHKFQEALLLSSWGFLLLGSPMLVAYGVVADAPGLYFALLLPFLAAFIFIPGGVGAIGCMLLVRLLPRLRSRYMGWALLALIVVAVVVVWRVLNTAEGNLLTPRWFQSVLGRLQFSEHRLLPSWWLSSGLLDAASSLSGTAGQDRRQESFLFLSLLVSNALFFLVLTTWTAQRWYRRGYCELYGEQSPRRPRRRAWIDRLALACLPLSPALRQLFVKDLRLFRRDPVQWSQFLIFFGLLGLYFVNIRRFQYDVNYVGWVNMLSFLNLAVVGLILSTFTTRFIFPMVSLEGRRLWILGLLPLHRDSILWGKFIFASAGSLIPCSLLILLSDLMLRISGLMIALHQVTCLILCVGLSGMAVGLGAKMPDLREESPSKIAAGFGGTLNLVLSALYIVSIVLLNALPCHFYLAALQSNVHVPWLRLSVLLGAGAAALLGLVATVVPLWLGLRAFRRLEL